MARIGVAVVGAGFMGGVHAEALRRAGCEVVGVLGVSDAESTKFASAIGAPKAYRSLKELLDDPAVAVGPHRHAEQAALRDGEGRARGGQARAVREAAGHDARRRRPSSWPWPASTRSRRPASTTTSASIRSRSRPASASAAAQLGKVHHVSGSYVQDWLLLDTDYNWRVLAAEGGELRAVADIGTHWLDLVHAITGLEVESVCADLRTVHPVRRRPKGEVETFSGKLGKEAELEPVDITTEDYGAILLRFVGGARGSLVVSQVTAGRKNSLRYEIAAEKGALAWNSESPEELWIGRRGGPNELLMRDPSILSGPARAAASRPRRATPRATPTPSSSTSARSTATSRRATSRRRAPFATFAGRPPRGGSVRGRAREPQDGGLGEGVGGVRASGLKRNNGNGSTDLPNRGALYRRAPRAPRGGASPGPPGRRVATGRRG